MPVYLVGGAIRDYLQQVKTYDYDFIVQDGAIELARQIANDMNYAFYVMDRERGIARILLNDCTKKLTLDLADYRGKTLEEDLDNRDFTINAMAMDVRNPGEIIDPLHGQSDFQMGIIRACSPGSFLQDPVRCLRAIRFSNQMGFVLEENTKSRLLAAVNNLLCSSIERQRDEFFNILSLPQPIPPLQSLMDAGIMKILLPELVPLVGFIQTPHHVHDAWKHTLAVVDYCRQLVGWINSEDTDHLTSEYLIRATKKLKPIVKYLKEYFKDPVFESRSLAVLFQFAALYHDVGKPATRSESGEGIQFVDHELNGARMAAGRAHILALSKREVGFIEAVIRSHMAIHPLVKQDHLDIRKSAYEYFQSTGKAGVADCLFSLADLLATYEEKMDPSRWDAGLVLSSMFLDVWANHYQDVIEPKVILNGNEIKAIFKMEEGPKVGKMLAELKLAQAMGKIHSKEEAREFIKIKFSMKEAINHGRD